MKRNDRFKIILIVMAVLICVLLFVVGYLIGDVHGRKTAAALSADSQEGELRDTVVNRDNVSRVSKELDNEAKKRPGSYEVIMNTEWVFDPAGTDCKNAYVENSRDNTNMVRFLLALEDKPDDILFTSEEIPVGGRILGISLSEPVPSGKNRAIVTYQLLDDNGEKLGEVKAGVVLIYENAAK